MKLINRRSYKNLAIRNWLTIFLIFLIFLGISHKILKFQFKLSNKNFIVVRGIYLENFIKGEKFLNSTQNLNIFFVDDEASDEKILDDGRQACSVESAGKFFK
jgi:hypothetical protein